MRKIFASLIALVLLTGLALAQGSGQVLCSFYDDHPDNGGQELTRVSVLTGAVSNRIHDIEDASYVTVWIGDEGHTFELFPGGAFREDIYLNVNNADLDNAETDVIAERDDAMSLAEVIAELLSVGGGDMKT